VRSPAKSPQTICWQIFLVSFVSESKYQKQSNTKTLTKPQLSLNLGLFLLTFVIGIYWLIVVFL